jgi:hypothetical protein
VHTITIHYKTGTHDTFPGTMADANRIMADFGQQMHNPESFYVDVDRIEVS